MIVQISPLTSFSQLVGKPHGFGMQGNIKQRFLNCSVSCVVMCVADKPVWVHSSSASLHVFFWAGYSHLSAVVGERGQPPWLVWCHILGSTSNWYGFFPVFILIAIVECCLSHCCDIKSLYEQINPLCLDIFILMLFLNLSKQSM